MPKLIKAKVIERNYSHVIIECDIKDGFFNIHKTVKMFKELVSHNTFGWKRFDDGYVSYDNNHSLNAFLSTKKEDIIF